MRLRDLSGLIVIDFIDMEIGRNRSQVERRLKEAMRNDRARIQLGRISPFGLLELSRQRLRPSLLETSFGTCPNCGGAGLVRSTESTALHLLRVIEEEGIRRRSSEVTFHVPTDVAFYILNHKRASLGTVEDRYGLKVVLVADDGMLASDFKIERTKARAAEDEPASAEPEESVATLQASGEEAEEEAGKKRRRRRSRRRKKADETDSAVASESEEEAEATESSTGEETEPELAAGDEQVEAADSDEERPSKRRRRGKRGGRRRRGKVAAEEEVTESETESDLDQATEDAVALPTTESGPEEEAPTGLDAEVPPVAADEAPPLEDAQPKKKPARRRRARKTEKDSSTGTTESAPAAETADRPEAEPQPKQAGEPEATKDEARPVESSVASNGGELEDQVAEDESSRSEAKTVVIDVDSDSAKKDRASRRGWWQRLLQ